MKNLKISTIGEMIQPAITLLKEEGYEKDLIGYLFLEILYKSNLYSPSQNFESVKKTDKLDQNFPEEIEKEINEIDSFLESLVNNTVLLD